jgi:hypothetical protein
MMPKANLFVAVLLILVGIAVYIRVQFGETSPVQKFEQPGLAGSLEHIVKLGDLADANAIGASLALQFSLPTESRGRNPTSGEKTAGRFLQYGLIENNNSEIDSASFYYIVFTGDGNQPQVSSQIGSYALGCVTQEKLEGALGALTHLPAHSGRWANTLMRVPPADDGIRIELGLTRGCLREFRITQDRVITTKKP